MAEPALTFEQVHARGLVKVYGATRALLGVDVELRAGTTTVIVGPNGSGKSTLLGILAQLIRPTRGTVAYGEHSAEELRGEALRQEIGVLAHAAMIYPDLSGLANLHLYAALHDVPNASERVRELTARFEIGRWGERRARSYSRGQLQRIALSRAVVHEPKLLLLDEPSTGLDKRALARLVETVDHERSRGAIIGVITHDEAFAEAIADRRIELRRGRVADQAKPQPKAATT